MIAATTLFGQIEYNDPLDFNTWERFRNATPHPRCLVTSADVEHTRNLIKTETWAAQYAQSKVLAADKVLADLTDAKLEQFIEITTPMGFFYPCPACRAKGLPWHPNGTWGWNAKDPDHIYCNTCKTVFPHPDFPEDIEGFHIHCHCESSAEAFARTLVHIINKFSPWFPKLKWINFGGGHLMTRKDYNVELLIQTLRDFHTRWPHLQMILEPGSAFAWQTGPLVSSVVDIVENHGIRTAILDVSFTCHMPDCLEMPYYPEVKLRTTSSTTAPSNKGGESSGLQKDLIAQLVPSSREGSEVGLYRLGGNSCLSGDFMGTWLFPRPLAVGDEIIFEDMIHYTTVKTTTFNGVHHPSLVLKHLDGSLEVLREYTYEDYRDRMD